MIDTIEPFIVNITEEDISNEDRLAAIFSAQWNCIMKKEETMHPIDFSCWRLGESKRLELKAWAETRVRDHTYGAFPTIYLALKKYMFAMQLVERHNIPVFFIVEWGCGCIGYSDLSKIDGTAHNFFHFQNKNYRNQKRDVGTVINVPLDEFTIIQHGIKENRGIN